MKKQFAIFMIVLIFAAAFFLVKKPVEADSTFPPLPTATAYVTPESPAGNAYRNEEYGISITLPDGISAEPGSEETGTLQNYVLGDYEGFGWLYGTGMTAGESLQEVSRSPFDTESSYYDDVKILKDEAVPLPQGGIAWHTRFTGYDTTNNYTIEIRLYTITNAGRAVTLEFYSLPENLVVWNGTINRLLDSITLFTPTVFGMPRDQVLIMEGGESSNPLENDPATMHSAGDYLIYEGLVNYNEALEIVPALAASWEISDDGTIYTFHLQPNAIFHNGKPVTAADVVYSWERAADPATNSDMVMTYLNDVVGVKEMHEGQADQISGLKIIDDHTLEVTLDASKPYFLYKLTASTTFVLDRENVETGEEWYRTPNGTGPYRLVRWDSMERMIYERFDGYYGEKPSIPMIIYTLYTGDAFRLYENGSVDIAGVSDYNVERVSDPSDPLNKELVSGVSLCTSYIQFDVSKPPFDDVKVRQAFNLAFDKEKFLNVVLKNTDMIANGIYPPALPGHNLNLQGYGYDPELARELIAESTYGSVEAFPEIIFTSSGYGSYADGLAAAMSQMWEQNLGVAISVRNIDPERYYDPDVTADYGQLTVQGWCADYPDPENFADVLFHSGTEMNRGSYSNPEVDRLLEEARVEQNVAERIAIYQAVEQMIVDDAPAIFLYHSGSYTVVKPYVRGLRLSPVSAYPALRFLSIDPDYWN